MRVHKPDPLSCGGLATDFQIETVPGEICDEVLRGAFLIPGGCADQVAKAIELKLFARGRQLLDKVRSIYESKHGDGSWPGPKPVQLSYRRLAGALVMSDTCHAARAAKDLIIEFAAADVEKALTDAGLWDGMDATQRQVATRAYVGDCTQHLRNILLDAMSRAASSLLKEELQESLEAFSSYERMTTEPIGLIRAVYKEFHQEGEYALGKGKEFMHWLSSPPRASLFFLHFERARGGRQDLDFDGCVPIYANRVITCTWLREQVFTPPDNILEAFLWHSLSCLELVALTRVMTLWDLLLSLPLRWLCGSSSQLEDWSMYDMGPVLDLVEGLLERVAADGEVLLDPSLDIFASIAEKQPRFRKWRAELLIDTVLALDGVTKHPWYTTVLKEAQTPTNKSNQDSTDMTIQLAMAMAAAGLEKMHDPRAAIRNWLASTDGKHSTVVSSDAREARAKTVGAHHNNDRVESNFGCFDAVIRIFRTISVDAAAGMAQQMRMHYFDSRADPVARRKATPTDAPAAPSAAGFFDTLPEELQEAFVEMARLLRNEARQWERADRKEQGEYRQMKREQNMQAQLDKLAAKGAIIWERFNAHEARRETDFKVISGTLSRMSTDAPRIAYLREQIELRVFGFDWDDLAVPLKEGDEPSKDQVVRLKAHLRDVILVEERNREIPSEAPLPAFKAKTMKQLGTPTTDSLELAAQAMCSPEQLRSAIERECQRRVAAGFADAVQAKQPKNAPTISSALAGKKLEICWNYISTEDSKTWVRCVRIRTTTARPHTRIIASLTLHCVLAIAIS
jgi:hypothetical protein